MEIAYNVGATENEPITFVCPECGRIREFYDMDLSFQFSEAEDPHVKARISSSIIDRFLFVNCQHCGSSMFMVDSHIARYIGTLNAKGYNTLYSCSGHTIEHNIPDYRMLSVIVEPHPYVMFGIDQWMLKLRTEYAEEGKKAILRYSEHMFSEINKAIEDMIKEEIYPFSDADENFRFLHRKLYRNDDVQIVWANYMPGDSRFILELDPDKIPEKTELWKGLNIISFWEVLKQVSIRVPDIKEEFMDIQKYIADLDEPGVSYFSV